jgi:hypothetical protein
MASLLSRASLGEDIAEVRRPDPFEFPEFADFSE